MAIAEKTNARRRSDNGGNLQPAERPDVFLSYSRRDRKQAFEIAEELRKQNFKVWVDAEIQSGRDWRDEIQSKMARARCVVLYWSKNAEKSWWVAYEAFSAQQLDKLVITSFDDINAASGSWAKDLQCTRLRRPVFKHFRQTERWAQLCRDIERKRKRLPRLRLKGWLGGGVVHTGGVTSVAFHPDDESLLVTSGRDGRAFLWDVGESATALKVVPSSEQEDTTADAVLPPADFRFEGRVGPGGVPWAMNRAGFSSNGDLVFLACEDGTAVVFRGKTFRNQLAELAHTRAAYPDYNGSRLTGQNKFSQGVVDAAIASEDRVLTLGADFAMIWSLPSAGQPAAVLNLPPGARGRSIDCCYSESANAFYVTDRGGRIHRIDASNTLLAEALPSRSSPGSVLSHSPSMDHDFRDGEYIASCSLSTSDRRIDVHQWDGERYVRVGRAGLRADYPVRALAMHPDAPVVVAAAGFRPALIAWDDGSRLDLLTNNDGDHVKPLQAVAVSRSGRFVAAGGEDGCVSVWEDETPRGRLESERCI